MQDSTWIRSYNNKSIYHNTGILRTDGTLQVGSSGSKMNVPASGTPTIDGSTILHAGNTTIPTVNDPTITITQTGISDQTFTLNQSGNTTIALADTNTDTNTTYGVASGGGLAINSSNEFSIGGSGSLITNLLNVNQLVANHISANAITAEKISAGSITAEELAISNSSSGSQGIYFSTTAIEIRDANRVRVKIGAL